MKLPRDVSGADVIRVLCRNFGYVQRGQVVRTGTFHGILKSVAGAKGVSIDEIVQQLR